jgi:exoribonuclease-2
MKEGLVRADTLPLVFRAVGADRLPRGARVKVRITGTDLLTLDVHASVLSRIDDPDTSADDAVVEDAEVENDSDSEDVAAGPLTLAIDVAADAGDEEAPTSDAATAATPAA